MSAQDTSFAAFVSGQYPSLLRFAFALCGDRYLAEDLVQEALERLGTHWQSAAAGDPFAYARKTVVNLSRSKWRRARREIPVAVVPETNALGAGSLERHDDLIWDFVVRLPRRQRAVLALRFYEDLSVAQCAELLRCSEGTVKSQTAKALASLRKALEEVGGWTH